MNDCRKSAQNSLCIQSVDLREGKVFVRDDVNLDSLDRDTTKIQSYKTVLRVKEASAQDVEKNIDVWDYRFVYSVGARIILEKEEKESATDDYKPVIEIAGVFEAKYISTKKLDENELKAFYADNVGYHIWPYWREYVQSSCARIGFSPAFEVPFYIIKGDDK
jgi:hypothetical protein